MARFRTSALFLQRKFFANRISATLSIVSMSVLLAKSIVESVALMRSKQADTVAYVLAFLPIILVAIAAAILLLIASFSQRRTQIFVLLSSYQNNPFYTELLGEICTKFRESEYDVIVKMPDQTSRARRAQLSILESEILANRRRFSAGFIVPVPDPSEELTQELKSFCNRFQKPLVFMDLDPFGVDAFGTDPLQFVGFVGFDGNKGGLIAGKYACEQLDRQCAELNAMLKTSDFDKVSVLIVSNGTVQEGRARVFEQRVWSECNSFFGKGQLEIVKINGEDSQLASQTAVARYISSNARTFPAIIFCVQDQMTIGAARAVLQQKNHLSGSPQSVVIGFDGIREVKVAIDDHGGPIRAAIEQDPMLIAAEAFTLYQKLSETDRPITSHERYKLLEPTLYKSARGSAVSA